MGIQGLLPLLKSIQKPTHLRNFAGQTLGVDAYGWLHRGTISCAIELAEGKPTRKHIEFTLNRVRMLIHFGVKPYLVFDGDYLPSKSHTEKDRAARRRESKRVGLELLRTGRSSQAQLELQKSIDVTPAMARELIDELKQLDVPYVVAPYEADSQLAYLEKQGIISGVLSEDSDLLVFGVKRLLTKLDQYGECIMINREHFTACREISLVGWSDSEFRLMAMLSGCDYLPGIGGMGLKTAYRLVRKHKTIDRIVRTVQFDGKMKVPPGYLEAFIDAERTFLYQWVFCPQAHCFRNLADLPDDLKAENMPFIGKFIEPEIAAGVACGDLDPNTKQPIILPRRFQHPASRAAVMQTPKEKGSKSIGDFFRARVPLAELDVNSFTPSPSQRRLLDTQRNASWSASHVPASQPSVFNRLARTSVPSSAPQAFRRTASDPDPLNRRFSSPKRQRLCSDASSVESSVDKIGSVHTSTSRFFAEKPTYASPLLRKKPRNDKSEEFELWSDDSVAEAVAAATSTPGSIPTAIVASPRKRKKLQVFADASQSSVVKSDESQASVASTTPESQNSGIVDTPGTSYCSSASSTSSRIYSHGKHATITTLQAETAAIGTDHPVTFEVDGHAFNIRSPCSSGVKPVDKSALERNSTNNQIWKDVIPASPPTAREARRSQEAQAKAIESVREEQPANLKKFSDEATSALTLEGSEDFLVPNSPDDLSEDSSTGAKLHLSRFAFAG